MSVLRLIVVLVLLVPVGLAPAFAIEGEVRSEGKYKITFDPFNMSLMKRGRVVGQVDLRLVLELEDGVDYEVVNNLIPQIRSDFTIALTDLARQQFDVNRPINPDLVVAYLQPYADYRLGKDKVKIFVQHALIEPK